MGTAEPGLSVQGPWQGQWDVAEVRLVPASGTSQLLHGLAAGIAALDLGSVPGESLQAKLDQWDQSRAEGMHRSIFFPHIPLVFVGRAPLKLLCDNMKYQILSRAFYGCEYLSPPCCLGICDGIRDEILGSGLGVVLGQLAVARGTGTSLLHVLRVGSKQLDSDPRPGAP